MSKKTLLQVAHSRDFDELENRWMGLLSVLPPELDEMKAVIAWLRKVHEDDMALLFTSMLMEALEEQRPGREAYEFAVQAGKWFPDDNELRAAYVRRRLTVESENPALRELCELSGLQDGAPREECISYIDARAPLIPGTGALHRRRRFPAMIISFSPRDDMLVLSDGSQEYSATLSTFHEQYHIVPHDDLRFMKVFMRDELAVRLHEAPVETVHAYLASTGGDSSFREFKDFFSPSIITDAEWSGWWQRVRGVLMNDPWIECGSGTQPSLRLRESPRNREHSLQVMFDYTAHLRDQVIHAYAFAAQTEEEVLKSDALLSHCYAHFEACLEKGGVDAFIAWLGCARLGPLCHAAVPPYNPAFLATEEARKACAQECGWAPALSEPVIEAIGENDSAAAEICAGMLPWAPVALVEKCAAFLGRENPSLLAAACRHISPDDVATAEAFAWLWGLAATGCTLPGDRAFPLCDNTLKLLDLLEKLQGRSKLQGQNMYSALSAVRRTLAMKKYTVIRDVFRTCGPEAAQEFFKNIHSNSGISPAMKAQIVPLLSSGRSV